MTAGGVVSRAAASPVTVAEGSSPRVSADGRAVAFDSGSPALAPGVVTAPSSGLLPFPRGATRAAPFTLTLGNGGFALLPFVASGGTVRVTVEVDGYTP